MSAFARSPRLSLRKLVPHTKTAAPPAMKAAAPGDAKRPDPRGISPSRRTSAARQASGVEAPSFSRSGCQSGDGSRGPARCGATLRMKMPSDVAGVRLSLDLDDPEAVPYFLWDDPMTVSELRARLQSASRAERLRLLGRILREARDTDVWRFTTPAEVAASWPELERYLGRRREFWRFLLGRWQGLGLDGHR